MSRSFTDNTNSFNFSNVSIVSNVSNHYPFADDRSDILEWLSPLEPSIRHQDIRTRRADNVGEWLLKTDEFRRWCDSGLPEGSEHATLFCCGDPAVGKTFFSSLVVDRLCDRAKEQNIAVACFYVDFAAREEQSPTNVLGSLLKQIVGGLERIPEDISRTFQDYKKVIGGRRLRVPEIVRMLQAITSSQRTFICVDALDECVEGHRTEILDSLRKVLEKSPNTRIFLTGRRHIRGEVERYLGRRAAMLEIKPSNEDIVGYIRMRLSMNTDPHAIDSDLGADIIKSITEKIPETFLLISLTMDAILGEITAYGRRQMLKAMTDGLDLKDVYGATLERIMEQGGEKTRLGIAALMWISHSERLLQLNELSHALAVEMGSTDLNSERIPSEETLLSCCLGLVVVDKETSTVRLIHSTLQDYLYTCHDLFGPTHAVMAETCLTYLNSRTIQQISPTLFALPESIPFLRYSSLYWGVHARRGPSKEVVSLALQVFSQIESHISTKLLLVDIVSRTGRYDDGIPINGHLVGFTGLHCAAVFGIVEIATILIDQPNNDLNKSDSLGITPLIWAAICGHEEVVKLLLEHQTVIPDKPDGCFRRTALAWAAGKGHDGIVRLFLGRASAKPNSTVRRWRKATRVVDMILGRRYVNPDRPGKHSQAPMLLLAAEKGQRGVEKLLLGKKDINHNMPDKGGQTPLSLASGWGREGVVKLLLGREDTNPNMPDKAGLTPLSWASKMGHEGVVTLLLARKDINPNLPDKAGLTPLSLASGWGRDQVVKLLLGRNDINSNTPNRAGLTPLSLASANGHERVVELLLEREDVDPERLDKYSQTPLWWATSEGHRGVVKLLQARKSAGSNTAPAR